MSETTNEKVAQKLEALAAEMRAGRIRKFNVDWDGRNLVVAAHVYQPYELPAGLKAYLDGFLK